MSELADETTEQDDADEHEHLEQIEGDEPAGEPDTTPAEAADAEGSAEVAKKLTRENERHVKAVSKILDQDMEAHLCPTCDGFGFADAPAETPFDVADADDAEQCAKCNGLGLVKTGSRQPGQETKPCAGCGGRGWREKVTLQLAPPLEPVAPVVPEQPVGGQWVPGRGFIPYGATEPLPGSLGQG